MFSSARGEWFLCHPKDNTLYPAGSPVGVTSGLSAVFQGDGGGKRTRRDVCKAVSDDYFVSTQIRINLDHDTLARLSNGETSLTEANRKKSWLTNVEQDLVIQFVIELALRGFPLSPRQFREHS